MYKITTNQLNDLISLSYGNKEALEILRTIKQSKPKLNKRTKRKPEELILPKAKECRARLIKEQTPQEVIFKALLKSCDVEYEFQKIFIPKDTLAKSFYVVDFYIPSLNIVFEIDGYYHYTEKGIKSDKTRDRILKNELGIETYRFSNSETTDKVRCIGRIEEILDKYYTLLS